MKCCFSTSFDREIKKVKETKKIFDKMGYDLSKYVHLLKFRQFCITS